MAEKDQARDAKGKFLGKYDTLEDAEKGHTELEKKYGEQAKAYGEYKKQLEQTQADMVKYQQWSKEAAPIVEWYTKFNQPISQWWQQFNGGQQGGQGQMNPYQQQQVGQQAYGQAAAMVAQTPGVELLTPQEKQGLIQQTAQTLIQQTLAPWTQNFAKTVETWGQNQAKQLQDQMEQRLKAQSDVMFRSLEHMVPAESLEKARAWQQEALKYADPSKIDPMKIADERLDLMSKYSQMERDLKQAREEREKFEKASMGSLGDGGGLFRKSADLKEMPKSREERYKNVFNDTKEAVGVDGMREAFPTL